MSPYSSEIEQQIQRLYSSLSEKDRRRYAAIEAIKLGWGGMSYISQLLGCDYYTLRLGMEELDDETAMRMNGIRRPGGGRKSATLSIEGLDAAFLRVLAQHTAGSPMDEAVKWTNPDASRNCRVVTSRRDRGECDDGGSTVGEASLP